VAFYGTPSADSAAVLAAAASVFASLASSARVPADPTDPTVVSKSLTLVVNAVRVVLIDLFATLIAVSELVFAVLALVLA
jgi:hypothetical protein